MGIDVRQVQQRCGTISITQSAPDRGGGVDRVDTCGSLSVFESDQEQPPGNGGEPGNGDEQPPGDEPGDGQTPGGGGGGIPTGAIALLLIAGGAVALTEVL